MSNLEYKFLSYEAFPNDPYVKEIVVVLIQGALMLPYQHIKMKDGGTFWTFPGCQAIKGDGMKKRVNAEFDSKSAKLAFENDLETFIASKTLVQQSAQVNSTQAESGTFSGQQAKGVGVDDGNLPF